MENNKYRLDLKYEIEVYNTCTVIPNEYMDKFETWLKYWAIKNGPGMYEESFEYKSVALDDYLYFTSFVKFGVFCLESNFE